MNDYESLLLDAWENELCIDFYSNTITDPEGNSWYWQGIDLDNFKELLYEVIKEIKQ